MKEYNCPDCERTDNCEGCPRTLSKTDTVKITHIPPDFPDSIVWPRDYSGIPNCCRHCPNHPINGGDSVCTCDAPLFDQDGSFKITRSAKNAYYID